MFFDISSKEDVFLKKVYDSSMKDLGKFFRINWTENKPSILLISDRKTVDLFIGRKTENWIVGWVNGNFVCLLDRKNYEKESCHEYSDSEYSALIKHELAHLFTQIISKIRNKPSYPKWLFEGIAIYLSGQNAFKKRPEKFSKFLDFYEKVGKGIYHESGFVVEFLVKKFGRQKLIKLLKSIKEIDSKKEFNKKFKEIYEFDLNYINFNEFLKTK